MIFTSQDGKTLSIQFTDTLTLDWDVKMEVVFNTPELLISMAGIEELTLSQEHATYLWPLLKHFALTGRLPTAKEYENG